MWSCLIAAPRSSGKSKAGYSRGRTACLSIGHARRRRSTSSSRSTLRHRRAWASGLPGAVNNHFWGRFGGALMLTLVQGGLDAATIEAAGNGSSNSTQQQAALGFVYSAQSNGQSVANTALQNTINIPPTLTKNQGDTVGLIVAHDLDFSNVYTLQVGGPPGLGNGG